MNHTWGDRGHKTKRKQATNPWLFFLYWTLVLVAIYFCFFNIQPYESVVTFLGGKVLANRFFQIISYIPIINGIAAIFLKSTTWAIAALLWAPIQIVEILPLILRSHAKFMAYIISSADSHKRYKVADDDDPVLASLKRTFNALPTSMISNLEYLRAGAYVIEFCVAIFEYPPTANSKITDLFFVLATGQFNKLDYANLFSIAITLFIVEILVVMIIWTGKMAYAFRESMR